MKRASFNLSSARFYQTGDIYRDISHVTSLMSSFCSASEVTLALSVTSENRKDGIL